MKQYVTLVFSKEIFPREILPPKSSLPILVHIFQIFIKNVALVFLRLWLLIKIPYIDNEICNSPINYFPVFWKVI